MREKFSMFKIDKVEVAFLKSSVEASGLPMSMENYPDYDEKRATNLGKVKSGSGHDVFLSGICVSFTVNFPEYWSPQFQRYHFAQIVSSQSKMHRITQFDINPNCNEYVDEDIIKKIEYYKNEYNNAEVKEDKHFWFMKIISNLPMGFMKKMRIVTNYLQLKTIYFQRKNHKLLEWKYFCEWILSLPKFKEFVGVNIDE